MSDDWTNNASLFTLRKAFDDYSYDLIVSHNPYNGEWVWNTAVKFYKDDALCFYDFGEAQTAEEGKVKARAALERWQAQDVRP